MPHSDWPQTLRGHPGSLFAAALLTIFAAATNLQAQVFTSVTELDLPTGPGAQAPDLFASKDGRITLVWSAPDDAGFAVRMTTGNATGWGPVKTITASRKLFVNWADFPSIAVLDDGTIAAHWLQENGPSSYDYDLNIALSRDQGQSWGDVIVPHRDGTTRQHGFATLLPLAPDRLLAIWLDGRAYDINAKGAEEDAFGNAMQLRAAEIGSNGSLSAEALLDMRTCTCCQTSAAVTGSGVVLVAYRDRSAQEIRDIALVRRVNGVWSAPRRVHPDNWEIDGCPVNGPAIDTYGEKAVVAWFTAADDQPAVNVAFSADAGGNFGPAQRVDLGDSAGRVDVLYLNDGSALVSWVEWTDAGESLMICRARPETGCSNAEQIVLNTGAGVINFPRMVATDDGVYITWTHPLAPGSTTRGYDQSVRMVIARL